MWWWIACVLAAHAGKWDGMEADVVAVRRIPVAPEALFPMLTNTQVLARHFPEACMSDWVFGAQTTGVGSTAQVTYRIASFKRKLTLMITKLDAPRLAEFDHDGRKGFITQFRLDEAEGGTQVTLGSYLHPPPWPFRGIYYKKIRPQWELCYTQALVALEAEATSSRAMGVP